MMTRAQQEARVRAMAMAEGVDALISRYGISREAARLVCDYGYTLAAVRRLQRMEWPRERRAKGAQECMFG